MRDNKVHLLSIDQANTVLGRVTHGVFRHTRCGPFGWGGDSGKMGFNGEFQEEFGPHYFLGKGYRLFIPALMRFNRPDPLSPFGVGGLNAYAYCNADPVNYQDPTGHMPKGVVKLLKSFIKKPTKRLGRRSVKGRQLTHAQKLKAAENRRYNQNRSNKNQSIEAEFSSLETRGELHGKYTEFPDQSSRYDLDYATDIGKVAAPDRPPKVSEASFYRESTSSPWQLDTSEFEANIALAVARANRSGVSSWNSRRIIKKAEILRKEYIIKHYNDPAVGFSTGLDGGVNDLWGVRRP